MKKLLRSLGITAVFALTIGLAVVATPAPPAQAATASDFDPGNIISDALFYDGKAMSGQEVQNFLNSKVAACTPGFRCLRHYNETTPSKPAATNNLCNAYTGIAGESAASMIARVGQACGISQKAIIILLEKEQSLITMKNPSEARLRIATGYACPDTAACDTQYYGFFNQVYNAALQFKRYQYYTTYFNHVAGRVNKVLFNPNGSCGSSQVFIQNAATAGLYNYTPYQPNKAALANLYGTGDSCSSYGNRNFWRLYTDWFGSTTGQYNLIKADNSPDVYFTTANKRHLIPGADLLNAYKAMGDVATVTASKLASYTLGQPATRIIRDDTMSMYLIDDGKRYPIANCNDVAAFGGVCGINGFVQMTTAQAAKFSTSTALTNVLGSANGLAYGVASSERREIADPVSKAAAGFTAATAVVPDRILALFPLRAPIVKGSSFTRQVGSNDVQYLYDNRRWPTTAQGLAAKPANVPIGSLSATSMNMLTVGWGSFNAMVTSGKAAQREFLLPGSQRWSYSASEILSVPADPAFVNSYRQLGAVNNGDRVKYTSNSRINLVTPAGLRLADSWEAVKGTTAPAAPSYKTIPDALMSRLPVSFDLLTPGVLYSAQGSSTLFLIDGTGSKITVKSATEPAAAGITLQRKTTQAVLNSYTTLSGPALGYGYVCNGKNYIGTGGKLVQVDPKLFPIPYQTLHVSTCQQMIFATAPASKFVRTPDGKIYLTEAGKLRLVPTTARFNQLGGAAAGTTAITAALAALIPLGANA